MNKILEITDLTVHFALKSGLFQSKQIIHAINGVSFDVWEGETLGIVGESGCGKSSLARALVGLNKITNGQVIFDGKINLAQATQTEWRAVRKRMQLIFQDPSTALNPRMTIAEIVAEPLQTMYPNLKKEQVLEKVVTTLKLVGLNHNQLNCYPTEFSGGQCQRIGIARALILEPDILICDEPVSALDVSVKAQIINLLQELQRKLQLTILFISHDLGVVKQMSDRILVMYLGNIMELGSTASIYKQALHPYTQLLLSAVPVADPKIEKHKQLSLPEGELPSPVNLPKGCAFSTRCPLADKQCTQNPPKLRMIDNRAVNCFKA